MITIKPDLIDSITNWITTDTELSGAILYTEESEGWCESVLITITNDVGISFRQSHYSQDKYRIQEYRMSRGKLEEWAVFGGDRDFIWWVSKGEVIMDHDAYLKQFRMELLKFPEILQEKKRVIEFSRFIRYYLRSKTDLNENRLLDSYDNLLKALHHWARLAVIEAGMYPDLALWEQVKSVNLGVYKLYEELTTSPESLVQRLQLVLLACEFSVVSKIQESCKLILQLLENSDEAIGLEDIEEQLGFRDVPINLAVVMNQLTKKSLVREVVVPEDDALSMLQLRYLKREEA